jgi:hypothetical protein
LADYDLLRDTFDPDAFENEDENGMAVPMMLGNIKFIEAFRDVDIRVPIIPKLLKRSEHRKKCLICSNSYFNLHGPGYSSLVANWEEHDMSSMFFRDLSAFSHELFTGCQHGISICTACYQAHIKSNLEDWGATSYTHMKCSQCQKVLSQTAIKWLAKDEDYRK